MLEESGEALELQLVGNGDGNIIRRNLRGPGQAGLLAVDQTATVDTPIVWTFADSAGTVTTTALVDASGLWRVYQRRFDSHGNVPKGKAGGDSDAALLAVPVVWRGLRQDEVSGLYLTGATVYDPSNGRYLAQLSPDTNPYRFNSNRPNSPDPATVEVARLDEPNSFGTYGAFTAGLADSFLFGNFSYAFGGDAAVQELARTNAYFVGQGVGFVGQVVGSFGAGAVLGAAKVSTLGGTLKLLRTGTALQKVAAGVAIYDTVGAGVAFGQSSYHAATGQFTVADTLGFLPALGFAAGLARSRLLTRVDDVFATAALDDLVSSSFSQPIDAGLSLGNNKVIGGLRESRVQGKLEARFGTNNVLRERKLLDASGKAVIDPLTGEARRIDFVVLGNSSNARFSVEVTSKTADKASQLAKEARIRAAGGSFIRNPATGELIDIQSIPTRVIRVN